MDPLKELVGNTNWTLLAVGLWMVVGLWVAVSFLINKISAARERKKAERKASLFRQKPLHQRIAEVYASFILRKIHEAIGELNGKKSDKLFPSVSDSDIQEDHIHLFKAPLGLLYHYLIAIYEIRTSGSTQSEIGTTFPSAEQIEQEVFRLQDQWFTFCPKGLNFKQIILEIDHAEILASLTQIKDIEFFPGESLGLLHFRAFLRGDQQSRDTFTKAFGDFSSLKETFCQTQDYCLRMTSHLSQELRERFITSTVHALADAERDFMESVTGVNDSPFVPWDFEPTDPPSNKVVFGEIFGAVEDPVIVRKGFPVLLMMFVALIGALPPMWPDHFYIILRFLVFVSASYLVYLYRVKLKSRHCIVLIILALAYNPIVPVRLDRWAWTAVDVVSLLGLFWILLYLRKTFIQEGGDLDPSDAAGHEKVEQAALLSGDNLFFAVVLPVVWALCFYGASYFLFLKAPEMTRTTQSRMTSMEKDFKQPRKVDGIFRGLRSAEYDEGRPAAIFAVGATTVYLELPQSSKVELEAGQPVELYEYRHSKTVGWHPVSRERYYWARLETWVSTAVTYLGGGDLFFCTCSL